MAYAQARPIFNPIYLSISSITDGWMIGVACTGHKRRMGRERFMGWFTVLFPGTGDFYYLGSNCYRTYRRAGGRAY